MTQYFLSWFLACFLIAEARAADLSGATDGVTTVAPAVLAPWYVKLGAAAVIDQTSSNLIPKLSRLSSLPAVNSSALPALAPSNC
jgi:hypothetical protein